MTKYNCDLHIHSCLSPCGDDEMTPANIAGMAVVNGLNIVALTDHVQMGGQIDLGDGGAHKRMVVDGQADLGSTLGEQDLGQSVGGQCVSTDVLHGAGDGNGGQLGQSQSVFAQFLHTFDQVDGGDAGLVESVTADVAQS